MNALSALMLNGFREARRNRVTTIVLVFAVVMILFATVSMSLTVATFERVMTDFGLGVMGLISAFLTIFLASGLVPKEIERRTIFMVLAKPMSRSAFIVGRYLGNVLTVAVITLLMGLLLIAQLVLDRTELHPTHFAAIAGLLLQVVLLSAVAFVFAAISSQFITAILSVSVFFLGHLTPDLYTMASRAESATLGAVGKALYYALPNLDRLSFIARATYKDPVTLAELGSSTLYALAYAGVMLSLACALFERRDFK
jgi:Cu-processing system permease protein